MRLIPIRLEPLGRTLELPAGTPLRDALFAYGVEFPCGGRGKCRRCRVRVLEGDLPPSPGEERILDPEEIRAGWRLACRAVATAPVTLEVGQWETTILADETEFQFTPREGTGVAVDVGTTTLVAQLLDLKTGHVLGVQTALNPQAAIGADVMSRVEAALAPEGAEKLTGAVRRAVGSLIASLEPDERLREIVLVGNTVMHHLFCAIDVEPLSHYPFRPVRDGLETFRARELGWELPGDPVAQFLPCLGGFVGSDLLAGILAAGMDRRRDPMVLIDLGTNGEIVVAAEGRILCASTAAGPAFEGGRISAGMRAATGAIAEAALSDGRLIVHVIGGGEPRGICGSGLVDLAACGLALGKILPSGRFADGAREWPIAGRVSLLQRDVRELQLAKAAVAAGIRLLLERLKLETGRVGRLYLAGAFGNYVNRDSARRIGLIPFDLDRVEPAGNTALLGAKLALFRNLPHQRDFNALRRRVTHVPLADDPAFQDTYVDSMRFPQG